MKTELFDLYVKKVYIVPRRHITHTYLQNKKKKIKTKCSPNTTKPVLDTLVFIDPKSNAKIHYYFSLTV